MKKHAINLTLGVALSLALVGVSGARQPDVLAATQAVEQGKPDKVLVDMAAAAKAKGVTLDQLMEVYKLHQKGGLGVGAKPAPNSGIEAKIHELQRGKGPTPAALNKEAADLIRLANVNIAMAEMARPHFPKPMNGKNKKDWDRYLDEQKQASRDLIAAVKAGKGADVARAARSLQNACVECHASFR
jgi:hypothetical protein